VVVSKKALDLPKVHVSSALGMFPSLQLSAQVHVAVHALQGEFVDVGELATGVGFSRANSSASLMILSSSVGKIVWMLPPYNESLIGVSKYEK
jgi:hypothetical protein